MSADGGRVIDTDGQAKSATTEVDNTSTMFGAKHGTQIVIKRRRPSGRKRSVKLMLKVDRC